MSNEPGSPFRREGGDRKPVIIDLPAQEVGRQPDAEPGEAEEFAAAPEAGSAGLAEVYPETSEAEAAGAAAQAHEDAIAGSAAVHASAAEEPFPPHPAAVAAQPVRRRAASFASLLAAALIGGALAAGATALLARGGYLQF